MFDKTQVIQTHTRDNLLWALINDIFYSGENGVDLIKRVVLTDC